MRERMMSMKNRGTCIHPARRLPGADDNFRAIAQAERTQAC
jgi:hypothetical protein